MQEQLKYCMSSIAIVIRVKKNWGSNLNTWRY